MLLGDVEWLAETGNQTPLSHPFRWAGASSIWSEIQLGQICSIDSDLGWGCGGRLCRSPAMGPSPGVLPKGLQLRGSWHWAVLLGQTQLLGAQAGILAVQCLLCSMALGAAGIGANPEPWLWVQRTAGTDRSIFAGLLHLDCDEWALITRSRLKFSVL